MNGISDLNKDALCTVKPPISTHPWDLKTDLGMVIAGKAGTHVMIQVQGSIVVITMLDCHHCGLGRGLGFKLLVLILVPRVLLRFLRFPSSAKINIFKFQFDLKQWTSGHSRSNGSWHRRSYVTLTVTLTACTTTCFAFLPAVEKKRDCSQSSVHSSASFAG